MVANRPGDGWTPALAYRQTCQRLSERTELVLMQWPMAASFEACRRGMTCTACIARQLPCQQVSPLPLPCSLGGATGPSLIYRPVLKLIATIDGARPPRPSTAVWQGLPSPGRGASHPLEQEELAGPVDVRAADAALLTRALHRVPQLPAAVASHAPAPSIFSCTGQEANSALLIPHFHTAMADMQRLPKNVQSLIVLVNARRSLRQRSIPEGLWLESSRTAAAPHSATQSTRYCPREVCSEHNPPSGTAHRCW